MEATLRSYTERGVPDLTVSSPSAGSSVAAVGDGALSDRHLASPTASSRRSASSGQTARSEAQARRLLALEQAAAEREQAAAERMAMLAQSQAMLAQLGTHHGAIAQLQQQTTGLERQWTEAQSRLQAFEEHLQEQYTGFELQWAEAQERLQDFEEVTVRQTGLQQQVDGITADVQKALDAQAEGARVVQRIGERVTAQTRQCEALESQQQTFDVILQQHTADGLRVAKQLERLTAQQSRLVTDAQGRGGLTSAKGKGKGNRRSFAEAPPGLADGADSGGGQAEPAADNRRVEQDGQSDWHDREIQDLQERMNVVQAEVASLRDFTNVHWEGQTALAAESHQRLLSQLQAQMTTLVERMDALPTVGDEARQRDYIAQLRQGYEEQQRQLGSIELRMRLAAEREQAAAEPDGQPVKGAALPELEAFNERTEARLRLCAEGTAQALQTPALQTLQDAQAESAGVARKLAERVTELSTSQAEVIGELALRVHACEASQPAVGALAEGQQVLEAAFESLK